MLRFTSAACTACFVLMVWPVLTHAQFGDAYGGGYDMTGGGEMMDPLQFQLDGEAMKASRVRWFRVNVSTLQVEIQPDSGGGMDSMGMGMGSDMAGYGGGSGGDMGSMMGGMGAMMGPGMSSGGGMAGMAGGPGMGYGTVGATPTVNVVSVAAFILDNEQTDGRTRIEVMISGTNNTWHRIEAAGIDAVLKHHAMLQGLRVGKKAKDSSSLVWTLEEGKLVSNLIRLKVWKDDAIKLLRSESGKGEKSAAAEKLLKALLTEDYEAQLKRQEVELARLKERIQRIQEELARRHAAKDRVVDVQLGKITLEAQGILGNSDF